MEMQDLDDKEKARRKKEQVEWRTKKNTSNTFMFLTTLVNIAISIILMVVLTLFASFILFRVFDAESSAIQVAFPIVMIAIFVGSMIIGFILYKQVARFFIKKFKLGDKLLDEVLNHYKSKKQTLEEYREELLK